MPEESGAERARNKYIVLKVPLHQHLLDEFNLSLLDTITREELTANIRSEVKSFIRESAFP